VKDKHIQMYMNIAKVLADTSSGVRLKVGAVLVRDNNIISTGYNALPAAIDGPLEDKVYSDGAGAWLDVETFHETFPYQDEVGYYKLVTKREVRHAERSVLMNLCKTNESAVGASLFVTAGCCKLCSIDILDAGIVEVFYRDEFRDTSGLDYLREQGVKVVKI
jgi:Deoxycytidylate deaminase